jgi:hypothetical protein
MKANPDHPLVKAAKIITGSDQVNFASLILNHFRDEIKDGIMLERLYDVHIYRRCEEILADLVADRLRGRHTMYYNKMEVKERWISLKPKGQQTKINKLSQETIWI